MGLSVRSALIGVYIPSGFCSTLAGVMFIFYMLCYGMHAVGIIQALISFDESLSSWWTRIVVGALLFLFCLLQRFLPPANPPRLISVAALL